MGLTFECRYVLFSFFVEKHPEIGNGTETDHQFGNTQKDDKF